MTITDIQLLEKSGGKSGLIKTSRAMLPRAVAGIRGSTLLEVTQIGKECHGLYYVA